MSIMSLADRSFTGTIRAARNWTSFQFIAFKGALITLAITTANTEVKSQQMGNGIGYSRYLLIAFLIFLLIITTLLEKWYHHQEDRRKELEKLTDKLIEVQSGSISYIFSNLLPGVDDPSEAMELIERIPYVMGVMNIGATQKLIGTSYQSMVEAMTTLTSNIENVKREIIEQVKGDLIPVLDTMERFMDKFRPPKPELEQKQE